MCSAYYKPEGRDESHDGEWLKTGDVATINEHGFIRLVDRSKDVIKSGGEWVSSADVENIIMSHPKVGGLRCTVLDVGLLSRGQRGGRGGGREKRRRSPCGVVAVY